VLRSAIWALTRSLRRATLVASYVGQAFGLMLVFWGLSQLLGGAVLNGLWTAFIGWFLNSAAESTRQQQAVQESLRGIRVAELMNPSPPTAGPEMTVQEFVLEHVLRNGHRAVLVADSGRLLGIVSVTDAKEIPQESWASTPVGRIMTPVPLKTVPRDADLATALRMLVEGELNQVPVLRDEQVVGLLSRADILRFLQLRDELDIRGLTGPRTGMGTGLREPHPAPRRAA
jgi:CBS domain-containing protein